MLKNPKSERIRSKLVISIQQLRIINRRFDEINDCALVSVAASFSGFCGGRAFQQNMIH